MNAASLVAPTQPLRERLSARRRSMLQAMGVHLITPPASAAARSVAAPVAAPSAVPSSAPLRAAPPVDPSTTAPAVAVPAASAVSVRVDTLSPQPSAAPASAPTASDPGQVIREFSPRLSPAATATVSAASEPASATATWTVSQLQRIPPLSTTAAAQASPAAPTPSAPCWLLLCDAPPTAHTSATAHGDATHCDALAARIAHAASAAARATGQAAPQWWTAILERSADAPPSATVPPTTAAALPAALHAAITHCRATRLILAGRHAAQAVLGLDAPLGQLRGHDHRLDAALPHAAPMPAIVTYDLAYLLRAPQAKAAFWADICRALAQDFEASKS